MSGDAAMSGDVETVTVMLVDDEELMRTGLRSVLSSDPSI